jgi:ABC-type sugar transport system permease subunit
VGALLSTIVGLVVALGVLVGLFTGANVLISHLGPRWEHRLRVWLFVGPAVLLLLVALFVPMIRTVYLSFRSGKRGEGGFSLDNYWGSADRPGVLRDKNIISFKNFGHIFTSRLFIFGVLCVVLAIVAGAVTARRAATAGSSSSSRSPRFSVDLSSPWTVTAILVAIVAILFAVFTTLRGVIWNNLWWVVAVTGLATVFGLGLAVLADRSRNESAAKTMIFMPMAISMVGAAIIWSYIYNVKGAGQSPGLLNATLTAAGQKQIDFLRQDTIVPWNNFFIMAIMIWIQTGFAMVVLSAAIKSVPAEFVEAAKVDGATEMQIFWKITVPQILPTVLVVVTTLFVTVMKVFDLVKATTGGLFSTGVLANEMYTKLSGGNYTSSSTYAVIILLLVLPVVWFNLRRAKESAR